MLLFAREILPVDSSTAATGSGVVGRTLLQPFRSGKRDPPDEIAFWVASLSRLRSATARQGERRLQNGASVKRRYLAIMGGLVVKPRARILHGHDWVFSS